MYLLGLMFLIIACCVGFTLQNGTWGNVVMLINVVMSALIAVNYFEPLANYLESLDKSFTFLVDFIAIWAIFVVALVILRGLTDKLSSVKVKLRKPFDTAIGAVLGIWIGWVMVCFTMMSLHTAPLARNFMSGEFQPEPKSRMVMGLAPDRQWLGFAQKSSEGAFSRGNAFDPFGEFVLKYGERRKRFEDQPQSRVR
jgi:hypothetical protein